MDKLLAWFDLNRRDLPWRVSRDPYAVWVSEVMLQQTQVQTVIPFYVRWMERFPTVDSLAAADEQEALSLWQGLGYYRRCRLLLNGARFVALSGMPTTAADWRKVPGVGRYTAAAIASIAFDEPAPLADGNVERVFARVTGCDACGPKLTSEAWGWAAKVLNAARPGNHNEALMELGATVCKPSKPLCERCPLSETCFAYLTSCQGSLPSPKPRRGVVSLERHVRIPYCALKFGVRQIPEGEWWQGMWEFPREPVVDSRDLHLGTIKHVVTHHKIRLDICLAEVGTQDPALRWLTSQELDDLPMPAAERRALRLAQRHLIARSGAGLLLAGLSHQQ